MNTKHISLNPEMLENIKHRNGKLTARCPACASTGEDHTGTHLVIYPSGAYCCIRHRKDANHSKLIWRLAGTPDHDCPNWRGMSRIQSESRARFEAAMEAQRLAKLALLRRDSIVSTYQWTILDVMTESQRLLQSNQPSQDPRDFLAAMFRPGDLIWTGEDFESGMEGIFADRWRICSQWNRAPEGERIGPMTTPCTWQLGSVSRCEGSVAEAPYIVLDFDGAKGCEFDTDAKLGQHINESLAITNWVRRKLRWKLAAVIFTGGKSIHSWFHRPGVEEVRSLSAVAKQFGIDTQLLDVRSQPCRLPGQVHAKSGKTSRLLWLDESASIIHQVS